MKASPTSLKKLMLSHVSLINDAFFFTRFETFWSETTSVDANVTYRASEHTLFSLNSLLKSEKAIKEKDRILFQNVSSFRKGFFIGF